MDHIELSGPPMVMVKLRRTKLARRLSLRVSQLDGRVTMSLPLRTPLREARSFANEKEGWIRQALADRPDDLQPFIGGQLMFEGRKVNVQAGAGRVARLLDGQILVPDAADKVAIRIAAFLKLTARQRLRGASDHYAAKLGVTFGRISIRDTRSRWGSCSSAGNLMYSWRLIMAPPAVLDYVAAHEVAHLVEMNHSPEYWRVVARIYPDYKAQRGWLHKNGQMLHRYRF